jgi:hypothetical protein
LPRAERTSAGIETGQWIAPAVRLAVRAGLDRWGTAGSFGAAGISLQFRSPGDRVDAVFSADVWTGNGSFSTTQAAFLARTSTTRRGHVLVARGGGGIATSSTPPDIWFGGDTGATRAPLLRAHPIIAAGRLRTSQLGRQIVHASLEAQRWWPLLLTRVGAAVFVDGTQVRERLASGSRADVDAGIGGRLSLPGLSGTFRLDVARGLRDGMTTLSFVYEP